ncbi:MAG: RNA polymerase sigma factor [Verrucomicrobiota bacterium JB023]|nr:RNA polymerase sigma factor [Verrucomicrobiota bacterium JB023]
MEDRASQDWKPLLARVRTGESDAESELVALLWPRVSRRIAGLCPRRMEIEDLAQEVFMKIFAKLWQYRGGSFEAWVDVMTRRVCYDALRKQRVRPEWRFSDLTDFDEASIESEKPPGSGKEAGEIISLLLNRLPAEQAWLLTAIELEEKSIGEVAREMGWTEVAGRLRLMRARRSLKRVYDDWNRELRTME